MLTLLWRTLSRKEINSKAIPLHHFTQKRPIEVVNTFWRHIRGSENRKVHDDTLNESQL